MEVVCVEVLELPHSQSYRPERDLKAVLGGNTVAGVIVDLEPDFLTATGRVKLAHEVVEQPRNADWRGVGSHRAPPFGPLGGSSGVPLFKRLAKQIHCQFLCIRLLRVSE